MRAAKSSQQARAIRAGPLVVWLANRNTVGGTLSQKSPITTPYCAYRKQSLSGRSKALLKNPMLVTGISIMNSALPSCK